MLPGQYFDAETGLHQNYFRDYDPKTGRYKQADPIGLAGGMNPYGYAEGNPIRYTDSLGLLSSIEALGHYIWRSGTSLNMQFSEIDTSSLSIAQFAQIQMVLNGGCRDQTINIDTTKPFSTSGDAAGTVGNITLKLIGTLTIKCDCTWSFTGGLSSLPDDYDFNKSTHRSVAGELSTTIGRQIPGKPYTINILGQKAVTASGKVNGTLTCCK